MAKVKIQGHASGTGILTVTAPNTSTDRTITLPDATGTLLSGAGGRRNMIINGAMQVAQRGTSFAAIGNGDYSLDRWQFTESSIGAYTITQDSSAPDGFANSLKIDCTTADASPASGEWLTFQYKIEGQDLQQLKKGTASAESVTLSFWVKCNKTGNIQVNLKDEDNNRQIGNTVTIDSADTWEQKSLTFAGDTTGALGDDNACSMFIEWWLDSGSSLSSGAVPTSWETKADTDRNAGGTLAFADSTSNYINITGVQLELGTVATEYEHRSYGEELAACQRYYQIIAEGASNALGVGTFYSTTVMYLGPIYFNTMRATPTFAQTTGTNYYKYYVNSSGNQFDAWTTSWNIGTNRLLLELGSQSKTAGHATMCKTNNSSSKLTLDAEL
jgi:hypothetical protein